MPDDAEPSNSYPPQIHLNLNVRGLGHSPTVAINERSDELRREGKTIIKLGLGQSPFPVPMPVVKALQNNAAAKDYLAVKGLWELRQAVAAYHERKNGVPCHGENVLIGPGSKELMFLLQVVYYGELVVPTPAWVSYVPQAQIIGRRFSFLHTTRENSWCLLPTQLAKLCEIDPERPRILILNYPSNPNGTTYAAKALQEIAKVARQFKVILLSDEIYGELHHKGQHISVAQYYPEGTIISSGLSKWCGAGGWRLGTFTFPKSLQWLLSAMSAVASETYTSTSAPIQYAAIRAFEGGDYIERYLFNIRRILSAIGQYAALYLQQQGVDVLSPEGGFYLFPNFANWKEGLIKRGITTSEILCHRLLEETGIATLPGSFFGRPPDELSLRIAYVDFDGEKALQVIEKIDKNSEITEKFLSEHCPKILQAIKRICEWGQAP